MRLALAPKAGGVEEAEEGEAGADGDEVEETGVMGGAPGKRHFDMDVIE
jgi:hypothetical protein